MKKVLKFSRKLSILYSISGANNMGSKSISHLLDKHGLQLDMLGKTLDLDKIFGSDSESQETDTENFPEEFETPEDDFGIYQCVVTNNFEAYVKKDGTQHFAVLQTERAAWAWIELFLGESDFVSDTSLSLYKSKKKNRYYY